MLTILPQSEFLVESPKKIPREILRRKFKNPDIQFPEMELLKKSSKETLQEESSDKLTAGIPEKYLGGICERNSCKRNCWMK